MHHVLIFEAELSPAAPARVPPAPVRQRKTANGMVRPSSSPASEGSYSLGCPDRRIDRRRRDPAHAGRVIEKQHAQKKIIDP
jgi:hypothetical protein